MGVEIDRPAAAPGGFCMGPGRLWLSWPRHW